MRQSRDSHETVYYSTPVADFADMFVLVRSMKRPPMQQGGRMAMAFSLLRGPWQKLDNVVYYTLLYCTVCTMYSMTPPFLQRRQGLLRLCLAEHLLCGQLYSCTVLQFHSCTVLQLYSCTFVQLYSFTVVQLYSLAEYLLCGQCLTCTVLQLYSCTVLQLYSCTVWLYIFYVVRASVVQQ